MDNFDYKKYLKSNRINGESEKVNIISEAKKQGYDDREDESLGARRGAEKGKKQSMKDRRDDSYGKFGKRDAEKKGKNKINKENVDLNMEEDTVDEMYGKKYEEDDVKSEMYSKKYEEDDVKSEEMKGGRVKKDNDGKEMKEDARTDAEQEGYKDGFEDAKDDVENALKKMKVSELKAKIRENILSELTEAEEDVDVDIDVEDKVEVDAEADDIEIKRPGVKATIDVGLSPEEEVVQDSLKAAMDAASQLGNDKLADQIGNTITFFTREYVVGNRTD
jgi:hypothetical protein